MTRIGIGAARLAPAGWVALAMTMLVVVLSAFALGAGSAGAVPMTELERQRLVAHLEMTGSWLVDEVSGLSPAQLQFRRAPGTWSIMEVIEHLLIAEPIYWQDLQKALMAPPSGRKLADGRRHSLVRHRPDRTPEGRRRGGAQGTVAAISDQGWIASASCMLRCCNTPGRPTMTSAVTSWRGSDVTPISGCS